MAWYENSADYMVPADMSRVCTTETVSSTITETCEDPIYYYVGNILDIAIILFFAMVIYRFFKRY